MANVNDNLISDEMSDKIIDTASKLATAEGAHNITVRKILKELDITNRVFYNRFRNIDEVLGIVYQNTILKIRESIVTEFDFNKDFFDYVLDVVVNTLTNSYDIKMQFNQYVFENDSISEENFEWWANEIKTLINFAKEQNLIKDVNTDIMCYSIWCFCRGFNADAVGRKLPRDEAAKYFRYSFRFLLEGLKK